MTNATHLDLYQLTSLVPHWDAQRAHAEVWMSFFSRRLPRNLSGQTTRSFLVWAGLQRCLEWLSEVRFDDERIRTLCAHPMLGPALQARPELVEALRQWEFSGEVWAPAEGELLWAGGAIDEAGERVDVGGVKPSAMPPYLQIRTSLLSAKLIETPLLSIINHMTMVATKAAHLCQDAGERPILEFGSRRTHIQAAVDAAVAAYIGGVAGTSNVEAHHRYGVPVLGTMDHFAVQSWEQEGVAVAESERAFFRSFVEAYPQNASLLIDTYDMFGAETGIRNAVRAAQEAGVPLQSIRIDSALSMETLTRARASLDELGEPQAKIIASGGVDSPLINELRDAPVDSYGVGERLVTSADAPVGVGAVGKLSWIDGKTSMKRALGSGKATLPGPIQAFRGPQGDRLSLVESTVHVDEHQTHSSTWEFNWSQVEPLAGESSLIKQVWSGRAPCSDALDDGWLERARARTRAGLSTFAQTGSSLPRSVSVDARLVAEIKQRCQ